MLITAIGFFPDSGAPASAAPHLPSVPIVMIIKNPPAWLTPGPCPHQLISITASGAAVRLQLGEILCTYAAVNRVRSHDLMWSRREPSQQWHAAGAQGYLTGIDGKNCTQIINLGHPHATKKVTHIKNDSSL